MDVKGAYAHLEFLIPARGLIGLRNRLMSATQGEAIMHHNFHDYRPVKGDVPRRANGVMVSLVRGQVVAFALDNLQQRGTMFVEPGDEVYEGMIVAENARDDDMVVNPCKEKKLTNMRASGSDKNILLKPPRELTLELALEYIEDDELVEVTPSKIRLRKKVLDRRGPQAGRARVARRWASDVRPATQSAAGRRDAHASAAHWLGVDVNGLPVAAVRSNQSSSRIANRSASCQRPSRQNLPPGDAFVLIAALLVDPLHRRVHRVALDPMEPQLAEGEPGPDSDRVGRISAAPGRPLADQQAAGRPAVVAS